MSAAIYALGTSVYMAQKPMLSVNPSFVKIHFSDFCLALYKYNLIGGLLLIVLCCAIFPNKKAEHDVAQTGLLVPVQVLSANCNASAAFRFMHFTFKGQEHSVKVSREDCEQLRMGQTLQLQHLDKHPDVFLFPDSYSLNESILWVALFLLGCYAVISSVRRL